jgi:hypothetical protein
MAGLRRLHEDAVLVLRKKRSKAAHGRQAIIERLRSTHYNCRNSISKYKTLVIQDKPIPVVTDDHGFRKMMIAELHRVQHPASDACWNGNQWEGAQSALERFISEAT